MPRTPAIPVQKTREPLKAVDTNREFTVSSLKSRGFFLFLLFAVIAGKSSAAQGIQQFEGHITDSSGAAVPGANVTIHNEGTGVDVKVKTTGAGDYTAPYLKPGLYTITAELTGFQKTSKTHITLEIDQTSKEDFSLPAGNVTESVTVDAEGSQIELAKADRGEVIESERVQELPLDGRNALELFALSPGTQITINPLFQRAQDNVNQGLIVNGVTINPAAQYIDNVTNDNAGNYSGYNVPLDSIGQFKVVLNAYDASYGRSAGSAVNVSVKSGTNNIHGTVYEFALRPFLDASTWAYDFSHAGVNAKHRRDQFGVQLDGPIVIPHLYNGRDKAFFELQWDQSYESLPASSPTITSVPNPAWLTGNFQGATYFNTTTNTLLPLIIYDPLSPLTTFVDPADGKTKTTHQPFANNIIPTTCTPIAPSTRCSTINPVGAALAQYYNGIVPNFNPGPGFAPYQNNLQFIQVETDISRNGTVKLDYTFSDKDRASLRWGGFERADINNPNGIPASDPANEIASQVQPDELQFALEEIHTFSSNFIMNNKAVVSTYKQSLLYGTRGDYLNQLGFSSNFVSQAFTKNMIPYVAPTSNLGGAAFTPLSFTTPGRRNIAHEVAYEPDVTYVLGRHTVRGGVDLRLLQYTTSAPGQNNQFGFTNTFTGALGPGYAYATGYTSGNSIASLLIGDPNSGSSGNQINPFYSQHYLGLWAQDDFKLTSKLTINVGVRYDLLGARTERRNQLTAAFNPTAVNPANAQITNRAGLAGPLLGGLTFAGVNGVQRGAYATNLANIAPRFGAAYAFSDRTSLRFGFGEFFVNDETVNGNGGFSSTTNYTNSPDAGLTPTGNLANPFPTFVPALGASTGLATGVGGGISFVNPNYKIPSVWQYSASVEQLITKRDTLDISLSSTRAHGLPGSDDLNHISAAFQAQCDPARGAPSGNRLLYCDSATTTQANVSNPFLGAAAFSGTSYFTSPTIKASNLTRPFPEFTSITETNLNIVHSWYNSLQVTAAHQASRDLTLHFAYTWSKNMQAGAIVDTVNRVIQRQLIGNDRTSVATLSGVYYLPVGRGKLLLGHVNRVVDLLIGGYEVAPSYQYLSGEPWQPGNNFVQTANIGQHVTQLPFDALHSYNRLRTASPCVGVQDQDTGLITPGNPVNYAANGCNSFPIYRLNSAYSVQQNVVYSGVRNPVTQYFDASISKRFIYNDHVSFQIRMDANNALNHPNFSYGSGSFSNQSSVPDAITNDPTSNNFGTIQKGPESPGNLPREIQLAGKLFF